MSSAWRCHPASASATHPIPESYNRQEDPAASPPECAMRILERQDRGTAADTDTLRENILKNPEKGKEVEKGGGEKRNEMKENRETQVRPKILRM